MQHDKILILDFGSQVTQLIARRVREANVYCEVHPCDVSSDWVREFAADGKLKGILAYTNEPLVSIDLNHVPFSSTVDSLETAVLEGKLVRVVSWYDNEWGFSNRMADTAAQMGRFL